MSDIEDIEIVKKVKHYLDFKNSTGSHIPTYVKLSEFYKILTKEQKFTLLEWISEDLGLEMKENKEIQIEFEVKKK